MKNEIELRYNPPTIKRKERTKKETNKMSTSDIIMLMKTERRARKYAKLVNAGAKKAAEEVEDAHFSVLWAEAEVNEEKWQMRAEIRKEIRAELEAELEMGK